MQRVGFAEVLLVLAIALAGHLVHGQTIDNAGEIRKDFSRKMLDSDLAAFTRKIIGGTLAEQGTYKYMASLRIPQGTKSASRGDISGLHFCGGVLVAENVVLTAAHCVQRERLRMPPVDVNRYARDGGDDHESFKTIETRIHPDYKNEDAWQNYDMALLVLDKKSKIEPAELATDEKCFEGAGCAFGAVIGWGFTKAGDDTSFADELNEVKVPLVSRSDCNAAFESLKARGRKDITNAMVCAGEKGKDACRADSGGPLIVNDKVAGIVSWGYKCGSEVPGVYASVPKLKGWIEEQLEDIAKQGKPRTAVTPSPSTSPSPSPPETDPSPPPSSREGCVFVAGRWFPARCAN